MFSNVSKPYRRECRPPAPTVAKSVLMGLPLAVALLTVAGCQTTEQTLDAQQEAAVNVAAKRGQFESACSDASATVLSRNLVRAPQDDVRMSSVPDVTQYTVGVTGCGLRSVYTVLCQVGSSSCTVVEARQAAPSPGPVRSGTGEARPSLPPPPPNAPFPG
jgi:hypothetical protein